jgi:uncharacterized membrane protein YgcG
MAGSMYESPHPPHAVKTVDAVANAGWLGIDLSSIDWSTWAILIATVSSVAFIMLRGRNRKRSAPSSDRNSIAGGDAFNASDFSWGPGHHSHSGSDGGHHGGFFDGGGDSGGGGGHH